MKIVRIIARLNVGGPARHVVWLNKELQDEDFESVLLTGTVPEGEEDMSYFAFEHGVAPVFIPEMSRELSPKDIVSLWKVFRRIWREKPDVIHTHTAKAGTIGRLAGFFYRWLGWRQVKLIHTYHGHVFHSYYGKRKTAFFLFVERTLASLATDRIITISAQQRQEINEKFRVGKSEKFAVVPLGIDLSPFAAAEAKRNLLRDEIGARADEILVGLVGRLTEIKNIPMLLQTAKIYLDRKNEQFPKLKFLIIGDGHLRAELEREAEKLNLQEIVRFLGNRQDTPVFYAGLDIVGLTSLNEGTPLSLIEAMANGKPVVSTAVGGVVDLLGEVLQEREKFKICERGLSASSGDAEGFFEALIHLSGDDALRRTLGARGREFVLNNYSKERLVRDIKNLYKDLMKG